eukprot:CAMPEP_0118937718 /NCGR_PEP_ID=MMETSP1169-20130426/23578_1 /TAXON_ID=36882 /ORGANISM="Pyramimonas obovata, Strain CCMP722" /LENGTH=135 /DNA_ID=CAMNT_0006881437 /DNA_START=183 /DNA_END=590 /DNA_ORIENTATION=-
MASQKDAGLIIDGEEDEEEEEQQGGLESGDVASEAGVVTPSIPDTECSLDQLAGPSRLVPLTQYQGRVNAARQFVRRSWRDHITRPKCETAIKTMREMSQSVTKSTSVVTNTTNTYTQALETLAGILAPPGPTSR